MGFDDLVNKGKDLYAQNKDAIDEVRTSEQAEGISDSVLDKASDAAKKVAPGEHHGTVDDVRGNIDKHIGHQ